MVMENHARQKQSETKTKLPNTVVRFCHPKRVIFSRSEMGLIDFIVILKVELGNFQGDVNRRLKFDRCGAYWHYVRKCRLTPVNGLRGTYS